MSKELNLFIVELPGIPMSIQARDAEGAERYVAKYLSLGGSPVIRPATKAEEAAYYNMPMPKVKKGGG